MDSAFAMLPLALLPQEREGIPSWLIQAFLVFFFLVLPIVRGIRETLAKKKELEARRAAEPPPPADSAAGEVDAMEEARRRFEALVRGEAPPPPVAEAAPPVPPPVARPRMAEAAPPTQLAGQLSDLPAAPSENEAESAHDPETADAEHFVVDEESKAREENERRLREERESRTEFLRRERESGAGRRANVAADTMTSLGAPTPAARIERAKRSTALVADLASDADRRTALRRAIVAAELLGPPAALRDPASGPPGLRRSA